MHRSCVYITGPLSLGEPDRNVRKAIDAANQLADLGYAPFVPHLTHYWHIQTPRDYEDWMAIDFPWLLRADAVLRIPGTSRGADRETRLATQRGIPIFHDIADLAGNVPATQPVTAFPHLQADELRRARRKYPNIHNEAEGLAIILEEFEEFKAEVWKKQAERSRTDMLAELVQIAAMAQRTAEDCLVKKG